MKQGEIWFVKTSPETVGHEYQKSRPMVVIESDWQLKITNVITLMPFTSQTNGHRDDILVRKSSANNLLYDSLIKVHHISTLDIQRFDKKIGILENEYLVKVKEYLKRHFGI
jgi:mRNA-degrading endonuclease toxin of MazEF toxin-antitoxin module